MIDDNPDLPSVFVWMEGGLLSLSSLCEFTFRSWVDLGSADVISNECLLARY